MRPVVNHQGHSHEVAPYTLMGLGCVDCGIEKGLAMICCRASRCTKCTKVHLSEPTKT